MALLSLGDAADLVDVSIQDIWLKGSEEESKDFAQYYNVESGIVDLYVKDSSISGLGYATRTLENAIIVSQKPIQGYDKTYTQVYYDTLLPISRMMWKFGIQKRDLEKLVQEARKACADERERLCAESLDNGWSTSYTHTDEGGNYTVTSTGGNGVELFSNAQTREDGGTNNNNKVYDGTTYNMDFDYDALKAAHRTASLVLNPRGKPMKIRLDTLVCKYGSTVYFKALEILAAIRKGKIPESADNDGAGVPAFKMVASSWLSNDAYWFMFDSSMKNPIYGLQYKESEPIHLDDQNIVYKTKEIQYTASMAFDFGFNDYRGWVGSDGTNA